MSTHTTAESAIYSSIAHNCIAHCEDSPKNRKYLSSRCDNSAENGPVIEYWGTDDGDEWRVHIDRDHVR